MANELASLADISLGAGLAQMAKSNLSLRKQYNQYALNAQESGETPMSYEEWVKTTSDNS